MVRSDGNDLITAATVILESARLRKVNWINEEARFNDYQALSLV